MTRGYTSRLAISGSPQISGEETSNHQMIAPCFLQLCDLWFHDHLPVWTLMTNSKIDWYIPDHACVFLSLYCTTIFAKLHCCPIPIPMGSVCICCWYLYLYIYIINPNFQRWIHNSCGVKSQSLVSNSQIFLPTGWCPPVRYVGL